MAGAFGGELDCVLGGGDGGQSGGKSELGMAKEMDSMLHCRFTTLNPCWEYSKWRSPSSAVPTTVAGGHRPLERVQNTLSPILLPSAVHLEERLSIS